MADPQHQPVLDGFDRLTVRLYRAGLWISTLGVVALGLALLLDYSLAVPRLVVLCGILLAVADIHLYDKRIRWVITMAAQIGATLTAAGALLGVDAVTWAGTGFLFVSLSAFALKERFCFQIPGLRLVPAPLALGLVPGVLDHPMPAGLLFVLAAGPLFVLCVAKERMPLHFDVGDKSRYQI